MLQIDIRHGTAEDAVLIADLIRDMVVEMALFGGHAVNTSPEIWATVAELVKANSARSEYIYLIASQRSAVQTIIGLAAANIEPVDSIFVVKTCLHLGAVYTVPAARRHGVARQLIHEALKWGQQMNAVEADLNVLAANPARRLYKQLGFQPHEISMVMGLSSDQIVGQR